jgi:hypothetical protein
MSYSTLSQVGDNIYVNVTFDSSGPNKDAEGNVAAEYAVTKTLPILTKCDDYYCSIVRFAIPLDTVPLFFMPIVPNQPNVDLTPFIIGITTGGVDFPQNIIYVSENGEPIPFPPIPTQIISPYYFVFEYQNFITAINTALGLAFIASGLVGNIPYFYLNTTTHEINLVVDVSNFAPTDTVPVSPIPVATIFMNQELESYLLAFEAKFVGLNPSGRNYVFNLVRFGFDTTIPPFTPGALQKQFSQEYSVLNLWSSLRKILITTNSIPIISEYTPTNNSGVSSTLPILTDFIPQIELPGQSRSIAHYTPTSQYRLVDLKSSEQLNTIDLKIYWEDTFNNIFPLFISEFQQASVKLAFVKKSLYKGGLNLIK